MIIFLAVLISATSFVSAAKKSKWQAMLERNGVPQVYWEKYLPKVSHAEYKKAVKNYQNTEGSIIDSGNNINNDEDGTKIVEGKYPLPNSEGKIAQEQHLWLKNNQSGSNHYAMSSTPKSCQNGMAGGYGAFGPLGKSDRQEEKYYVTMRWDYADWVEPESDLASDLSKSANTLTLENGKDFSKSGFVKIGSEYIKYSSRNGNKLKGLTRGYKSSASSHDKNDPAKQVYRYKGGLWEKITRSLRSSNSKKKWYKEKKVLVTNERNGKKVVASILESGPAIWTDRVGGLSPEAYDAIDAKNNEKCTFQYAGNSTKLGKVD